MSIDLRQYCNLIVRRYTRGGLIEQAFYIQTANAILPELSDLLNPFTFLTSRIMARSASSLQQSLLDTQPYWIVSSVAILCCCQSAEF